MIMDTIIMNTKQKTSVYYELNHFIQIYRVSSLILDRICVFFLSSSICGLLSIRIAHPQAQEPSLNKEAGNKFEEYIKQR
jgi:hypothetical protein